MSKKMISRIILAVMIVANIFLVYTINANNTLIASYDSGISQRSGFGRLGSSWTQYVGGSKNSSVTYEDRENAETKNSIATGVLFVLDIAVVGALYVLNKKPKPAPVQDEEEEWRRSQRSRRRR